VVHLPIQRKYDFKAGTKISSSQVDEEFDQLVSHTNQVESDLLSKDKALRNVAQLAKITTDNGAPKFSVYESKEDILATLLSAGTGFHTFYAANGSKNLPSERSLRGFFHNTSENFGLVFGVDSDNVAYTNYLNGNIWRGWRKLTSDKETQELLWEGNRPPIASQTTTPTKKLSECRNGWLLVWSDFDPSPENVANDYEFSFTYIPKGFINMKNGASCMFSIPNYLTPTTKDYTNKRLSIFNDRIIGHDDNGYSATSSVDVTLRYIFEY
jgi:hypothetical protein